MLVSDNININKKILKDTFENCADLIIRPFKAGRDKNIDMLLVYIDNIVSTDIIEESIMTNLMNRTNVEAGGNILDKLRDEAISIGELTDETDFDKLFTSVLLGDTAIFADGEDKALIASTKGWPTRGVPEAENEVVVQGPKDAFNESASKSVVLIRRRIRDVNLKVVRSRVGRRSKTDAVLMYMKGIARPDAISLI